MGCSGRTTWSTWPRPPGNGRLDEAIDFRERAYAAYVETGEPRRAALLAMMISGDHAKRGGTRGRVDLHAPHRCSTARGNRARHLALARGTGAVMMGQVEPARDTLRAPTRSPSASAIAPRGDGDRVPGGDARHVRPGERRLALLDEATAAAVSGELVPLATRMVYCVTSTPAALGDCGRAAEWTTEADRWCDRLDVSGFPGACRVHRAETCGCRATGTGPKSRRSRRATTRRLLNLITSAGFHEIGEIRRRRGDFAEAEEAYRKRGNSATRRRPAASRSPPGAGEGRSAAAAMRRPLGNEGLDQLTRAGLLPAQVEVALAAGELARARAAAAELEEFGDHDRGTGATPHLEGTLQLVLGRIRVRNGIWRARGALSRSRGRRGSRSARRRDGAGADASGGRLPRRGGRAQRARRDRGGEGDIERLGAPSTAARRRAPRRGRGRRGRSCSRIWWTRRSSSRRSARRNGEAPR